MLQRFAATEASYNFLYPFASAISPQLFLMILEVFPPNLSAKLQLEDEVINGWTCW